MLRSSWSNHLETFTSMFYIEFILILETIFKSHDSTQRWCLSAKREAHQILTVASWTPKEQLMKVSKEGPIFKSHSPTWEVYVRRNRLLHICPKGQLRGHWDPVTYSRPDSQSLWASVIMSRGPSFRARAGDNRDKGLNSCYTTPASCRVENPKYLSLQSIRQTWQAN